MSDWEPDEWTEGDVAGTDRETGRPQPCVVVFEP